MRWKQKFYSVLLFFLSAGTIMLNVSCGESAKERAQRDFIDSLENANAQVRMDYKDLQQYLTVIAVGLDSISIEENELLSDPGKGENRNPNRQRMKHKLSHVRDLLSRHRARIDELEKKLASGKGDVQNLRIIITALRQQLNEKERELEKLRIDLEENRKSMSELAGRIQQMQEVQEEQEQTISKQNETIQEQAEKLNKGYVKIASKKELKDIGLLTGGFLKKTKVDYSKMDLSIFQSVDIQTTDEIELPGKFRILTPVPDGSYEIVPKASGRYVLHILDLNGFWSVSNFLIIQTN